MRKPILISQLKYLQRKIVNVCAKAYRPSRDLLAKGGSDFFFFSLCFSYFSFSFVFSFLSFLTPLLSLFLFFFLLSRCGNHASRLEFYRSLFFGFPPCKPKLQEKINEYHSTCASMRKLQEMITI